MNQIDQEERAEEEAQTKNEGHSEDDGQDACEPTQEEDRQIKQEDEPELNKRLNRQRRRAIQAARGGRKSFTSRNTYKDKGGKLSHNSKIQKQLGSW